MQSKLTAKLDCDEAEFWYLYTKFAAIPGNRSLDRVFHEVEQMGFVQALCDFRIDFNPSTLIVRSQGTVQEGQGTTSKSISYVLAPAVNDRPDAVRPVNRPQERSQGRLRTFLVPFTGLYASDRSFRAGRERLS